MRRLNCREFHESRFCPAFLRDELTGFLSFFTIYSGVYDEALSLLSEQLEKEKSTTVIDNCAGCGLYAVRFARRLAVTKYFLADLYPNRNWERVAAFLPGVIVPEEKALNVKDSLRELEGVHIMFSALHHFSERELSEILQTGAKYGRPLFFCDYSQRRLWIEIPALLAGTLFFFCTAFLIWPFSWKRLLFTYVIPLLPLLVFVDGLLSRLRAYRLYELEKVIADAGLPPGYQARCGVIRRKKIIRVHWIMAGKE